MNSLVTQTEACVQGALRHSHLVPWRSSEGRTCVFRLLPRVHVCWCYNASQAWRRLAFGGGCSSREFIRETVRLIAPQRQVSLDDIRDRGATNGCVTTSASEAQVGCLVSRNWATWIMRTDLVFSVSAHWALAFDESTGSVHNANREKEDFLKHWKPSHSGTQLADGSVFPTDLVFLSVMILYIRHHQSVHLIIWLWILVTDFSPSEISWDLLSLKSPCLPFIHVHVNEHGYICGYP